MSEQTASQINIEQMEVELRQRFLLDGGSIAQAKAIASHYMAYAALAQQLNFLLKSRLVNGSNPESERIIFYMLQQIKTGHLHDLGIPLEWEKI